MTNYHSNLGFKIQTIHNAYLYQPLPLLISTSRFYMILLIFLYYINDCSPHFATSSVMLIILFIQYKSKARASKLERQSTLLNLLSQNVSLKYNHILRIWDSELMFVSQKALQFLFQHFENLSYIKKIILYFSSLKWILIINLYSFLSPK